MFISHGATHVENLDLTILVVQWIAALLMGADYLLLEVHRQKVNTLLEKSVQQYQCKLNLIMKPQLKNISSWKPIVLYSAVAVGLGYYAKSVMEVGLFALLSFGLGGALLISGCIIVLTELLVLMILIYPVKWICWFVERCPKGAIFGVGYLMLMLSFTLRFYETAK
jgi:hypothetical protein